MLLKVPFWLIFVLCIYLPSASGEPYPLGTMTCDDIGAFASEAMQWRKEEKITREQAIERLNNREFGDPVEKKNLSIILNMVYGNQGRNWNIEVAGNLFRSDCEKGRNN